MHPADVTDADAVAGVVASVVAEHGRIDVLVNNAGISDLRGLPSEHSDHETFRRVVEVDLFGLWYFTRDAGRHMLERGSGSIINIASILSSGGGEFVNPWYYAAKGAVVQLTKLLAVEWADRNVRVNAIAPGYFVTEMTRPIFDMLGMAPWIESRTPMRRLGDPERDLRGPILFLASDASSHVTGHNLFVDGGFEASRGAWQIPPSHFFWNKEAPQVGETYPGLVPNEFEQWKMGIPGLHFPMPEAPPRPEETMMELDEIKAEGKRLSPWAHMATVGADGKPDVVPVHPAWEGDTLWVMASEDSVKCQNVAHQPEVALHWQVNESGDGLELWGTASVHTDVDTKRRLWTGVFDYNLDDFVKGGPEAPGSAFIAVTPSRAVALKAYGMGGIDRWKAG